MWIVYWKGLTVSDHDRWLDETLDEYYEDEEPIELNWDDDWLIDKYIEDQIRSEDWYDE